MRKPTGQMQEETQKYLDDYNLLYNWDYNEMCDFIEVYGETEFLTHYETYHRLVEDYGMELVTLFADEFDIDSVEDFEDMYEGQFETGQDFAFYYVNEVDKTTKDLPNWVTIDYADIWENKLSNDYVEIDCSMSDYTYGHIFKRTV
jgi:antirestriction protein